MSRICTACRTGKPFSEFYAQKFGKHGLSSQCKLCKNAWRREYGKANKDKEAAIAQNWRKNNPRRHLANVLRQSFGISVEVYEKMLENQGGSCAICKEVNLDGRRLAVDHCHQTDRIRGLLCDRCNRGLGLFRDSVLFLKTAADYICSPVVI